MWAKERHRLILSMLSASQQVSANDLAQMLNVSRETVRRDLLDLEESGQVSRVHGGAVLPEPRSEEPFRQRMTTQIRAKSEIARKAAGLIQPGQTILVDAGTTTALFARELAKLSDLSVITNSIDIATTLQGAGKDVLLLGGRMAADVPSTVGELTLSEIRRFRVDLCFSAPVGVHPVKGAFFYDLQEAEISKAMAAQAQQTVILADQSKLGKTSRVQALEAGEIGRLVTNRAATEEQVAAFRQAAIDVMA
ncbi:MULTISPECIES: DeoR/GlpR family DNA-binding transcription regulator [Stappiaceae]|uniref:HTH-type transcriptional repressor GlcR n=1 Tax=Roseibium aggregatum TaxID=187304 RepID=A0A0M6Y0I8_9HYPH|nr:MULTISPECIES: DeoR/GlpR family DNA-binding transcription regulator [Stappiaceae]ERP98533.1 DeoR family transcriptional regulator [Labrenzia sp. C1B10]ERR00039.1 DeoR family transcriptional regulator [Labrenzia sp. C1B70]MEE2866056.1 DeoR/GlpR family DNA-binding transcription regulator [Pseudomonadota bacterium]CTQ43616.1 HTH-type transcriptional repressor GlcR [Roseibium aggregatum]